MCLTQSYGNYVDMYDNNIVYSINFPNMEEKLIPTKNGTRYFLEIILGTSCEKIFYNQF